MQTLRLLIFFLLGGTAYVSLEILWRGFSHYSMFLAGGLCFLLLGKLQALKPQLYLPLRLLLGAVVITAVELLIGLLFTLLTFLPPRIPLFCDPQTGTYGFFAYR